MLNTAAKIKNKYPRIGLVLLLFIAFIALGMPDGLVGVAWPSIHESFSVPLDSIGLLLSTLVAGYLISSFLSGPLMTRFGVGKILAVSCVLTGAGLIGYTIVPTYWMMVMLGIVAGLGAGAIDSGLNAYAAAHFSEGFMQWMHASYGIGITLGPVIMTASLTALNSWRIGYIVVGSIQLALAICFFATLSQWDGNESSPVNNEQEKQADCEASFGKTLLQPRVWLSALLFFAYAGCEGGLGIWAYTLLVQSRGIQPESAGIWVGGYWTAFTIGRIIAGLYAKKAGVNLLVFSSLLGALLGTLLLWWNPADIINLIAVALIGLAIAPIFPAMVSGTMQRVGKQFATNTIGIEMAFSSLGIAILPGTMGVLARQFSLEIIPVLLLILLTVLLLLYLLAVLTAAEPQNTTEPNPAS